MLMAFGLGVAFYVVHMRFWAMAVNDPKRRAAGDLGRRRVQQEQRAV